MHSDGDRREASIHEILKRVGHYQNPSTIDVSEITKKFGIRLFTGIFYMKLHFSFQKILFGHVSSVTL